MKEFDFTGVQEDLAESMLVAYQATLDILKDAEKVTGQDATMMELMGMGVSDAKRRVLEIEKQIQMTIDLFRPVK
jgi:hypothetical protein